MMKFSLTHRFLYLILAGLLITMISPTTTFAAEKDKAARRAALMMQKMKQDMEAEKAAMQAQFDAQKKELEAQLKSKDEALAKSEHQLAVAERKNKSLEAQIAKDAADKAALEAKLQQTQSTLEATAASLGDFKAKYAQAQADLKFNDGQRKAQLATLAQTNKSLGDCTEKNTKLHQFGAELIQLYDKPDRYEAVMRKESFFQLKRVELENILQGYQDRLDDAHYEDKKSAN